MIFAVYGTLKRGYGNNRLMPKDSFVDTGVTKNRYTLYDGGIPFVSDEVETSQIAVELFEVKDEETIKRIDSLEGHPSWYIRKEIPVIDSKGNEVNCWLYFNTPTRKLPIIESGEWKRS